MTARIGRVSHGRWHRLYVLIITGADQSDRPLSTYWSNLGSRDSQSATDRPTVPPVAAANGRRSPVTTVKIDDNLWRPREQRYRPSVEKVIGMFIDLVVKAIEQYGKGNVS
jgi:hypothetical protein